MTHLYLVRHGEAQSNTRSDWRFGDDDSLTARGVAQAERLRDRLTASREITADVLIATSLTRARQTAEIIAPVFGLPVRFDDDMQEMHVGEVGGLTLIEAVAKFGTPDIRADPFRPVFPGGENWPQFVLRVGAALDRISRQHAGKHIFVVCHGGTIDAAFTYFFQLSGLVVPPVNFNTENTSITWWELAQSMAGRPARWRLNAYNDVAHLADLRTRSAGVREDGHLAAPVPTEEDA